MEKVNDYPKISIITVVFNGAKTIEQTILSVISQNYENIEYIIIDGGSTDGTVDIIKKYEDKINYWISEADQGIYDAMNKGIDKSTGDIIGILNSDDFYDKDIMDKIINIFNANPECGIVHGDIIRIETDGKTQRRLKPLLSIKSYKREMLYFHPTFFVRRKVYLEIGKFSVDYKISSDFDFFVRAKKQEVEFIYLPSILVYMRNGGRSVTNAKLAIEENKKIALEHGYLYWKAEFIATIRLARLCLSNSFLGDFKRWLRRWQ